MAIYALKILNLLFSAFSLSARRKPVSSLHLAYNPPMLLAFCAVLSLGAPLYEALIAEVLEKNTTVTAARVALRNEYGADALILGGWHNDRIAGFGFKEKQSISFLKGERHTKDGYAYYPKRSCKAGKELATKLANPALTFQASSFIVDTLGISREVIGEQAMSRTGMAMYYTTAAIFKGKLLVKIPKDIRSSSPCTDDMPAVPTWLREVKESEFLSAQGK